MIGEWDLQSVATIVEGTLHGRNCALGSVMTDSRALQDGALFVAIRGDRFDGHDFLPQARRAGAVGALVESLADADIPQIVVPDTVVAFGKIGQENRRRFNGPVVAITGSVGKTTIKEMVSAILSKEGNTRFTRGNLNNHLGVPISLLTLESTDRFGVFELGANHLGEIDYTVHLVEPDAALLANAADAHLEGFGSRDGIARGKGEIFSGIKPGGTAILNRDSEYYGWWCEMAKASRQVSFGFTTGADVTARDIRDAEEGLRFVLEIGGDQIEIQLPLSGRHNVINAMAASALARSVGASLESIQSGLGALVPVPGRLRRMKARNGAMVIDDTYNASPTAVIAAIDLLSGMPGKRVAVLGGMAELGAAARDEHLRVARYLDGRADVLVTLSEYANEMVGELKASLGVAVNSHAEAVDWVQAHCAAGDSVLVKGSRSAAMEKVVQGLCQ